MKLAFGYTVKDLDDGFIAVAEESAKISGWAMAPGRWMVDYYPLRESLLLNLSSLDVRQSNTDLNGNFFSTFCAFLVSGCWLEASGAAMARETQPSIRCATPVGERADGGSYTTSKETSHSSAATLLALSNR